MIPSNGLKRMPTSGGTIAAGGPRELEKPSEPGASAPLAESPSAFDAERASRAKPGAAPIGLPPIAENLRAYAARQASNVGGAMNVVDAPVPLAAVLSSFSTLASRGFSHAGSGNLQYWLRAARDMQDNGSAMAFALSGFAHGLEKPSFEAAIDAVADELERLSNDGLSGDLHFWMGQTKTHAARIHGAGAALDALSKVSAGESVPFGRAVEVLAYVADSVDWQGRGEAEYWMRCATDLVNIAGGISDAARQLASVAPDGGGETLQAVAEMLKAADASGYGDAQYWLSRTEQLVKLLKSSASALRDISEPAQVENWNAAAPS